MSSSASFTVAQHCKIIRKDSSILISFCSFPPKILTPLYHRGQSGFFFLQYISNLLNIFIYFLTETTFFRIDSYLLLILYRQI